jgi:hypothetical protein
MIDHRTQAKQLIDVLKLPETGVYALDKRTRLELARNWLMHALSVSNEVFDLIVQDVDWDTKREGGAILDWPFNDLLSSQQNLQEIHPSIKALFWRLGFDKFERSRERISALEQMGGHTSFTKPQNSKELIHKIFVDYIDWLVFLKETDGEPLKRKAWIDGAAKCGAFMPIWVDNRSFLECLLKEDKCVFDPDAYQLAYQRVKGWNKGVKVESLLVAAIKKGEMEILRGWLKEGPIREAVKAAEKNYNRTHPNSEIDAWVWGKCAVLTSFGQYGFGFQSQWNNMPESRLEELVHLWCDVFIDMKKSKEIEMMKKAIAPDSLYLSLTGPKQHWSDPKLGEAMIRCFEQLILRHDASMEKTMAAKRKVL